MNHKSDPREISYDSDFRLDARSTTTINYIYDFGDNWEHNLTVSDVRCSEVCSAHPGFIVGKRDCPPEDCGGIHGVYEMLEVKADPAHPDHAKSPDGYCALDPIDRKV